METNRRDFLKITSAISTSISSSAPSSSIWPRLLSVTDEKAKVVVETTGARYILERTNPARITAIQKINGPRERCHLELNTSFADLTVDFRGPDQCVLYVPVGDFGFNILIHADSLLSLRAGRDVRCHMRGDWVPEYSYSEAGNLLLLDRTGGYGQYALTSPHPWGGRIFEPQAGVSFSSRGWETYLDLQTNRKLLLSIAPPREFDHASSVNDRIVHHFIERTRPDGTWDYYPTDATLTEYARHGNVLIFHLWQRGAGPLRGNEAASKAGMMKAAPWASRYNVPLDEAGLRRVVATSHRLGLRVLPYLSPISFPGTVPEYLDELRRLLDTYSFDGLYFDGSPAAILDAYELMKGTRRLLGPDRLLYVHIPSPILGSAYAAGRYAYCPFIDTYANFILRAEHIDTFDDQVLRYTISGRNISNAIGFIANYDYAYDFNRRLVQKALEYNVRAPWWGGWEIYLNDLARETGKKYPAPAEIHSVMEQYYFPALDKLRVSRP